MFLGLRPQIAVVTNIEHDHPDCFPTYQDFFQAFVEFVDRLPRDGILVACSENSGARQLVDVARENGRQVLTYGMDASDLQKDYSAKELKLGAEGNYQFKLTYHGENLGDVKLSVPGLHNVQNALAVLSVTHQMDLSLRLATKALGEYQGTERRFDLRGEAGGVVVIDDYAHHPAEIRATLAAARQCYPDRQLWAVWQPHTYSRTKTVFQAFTTSFGDADQVIILEVFGAREVSQEGFSARSVVEAIDAENVRFIPTIDETAQYLLHELRPGDLLVVLSAGDADQLSGLVLEGLFQMNGGRDE
jgi:UDP-N-acetylmuramate--alanine ligase